MARGHMVSSALAGLLTAPLALELVPHLADPAQRLVAAGLWTGVVAFFGLWPDIDHKPAVITKILPPVSNLVGWAMRWLSKLAYQATRTEKDRPEGCHRTFTHTLPFAVLTGAVVALAVQATPAHQWAWFLGAGAALGTLAHIGGDALTLSGVPIAWPLLHGGKRWATFGAPRWMRFRAGGHRGAVIKGEAIATALFLAAAVGVGSLTIIAGGEPWWTPIGAFLA